MQNPRGTVLIGLLFAQLLVPVDEEKLSGKTQSERELRADPKELAEHVMLIDLARNDVGKISKIGRSSCLKKWL